MNILFLTLLKVDTLKIRGIYQDLMNEFVSHGHKIYIISPLERREQKSSILISEGDAHFLNVRTLNVQKTNIIEKGFATLSIEYLFLRGVKKYFSDIRFDLVIYSTPPITFSNVIEFIKKKDGAKSYLLLKDIFPQNAVDMKMMLKNGVIYRFFRRKEKKLYKISDRIGCMSEANRQYIFKHNPKIDPKKVEVNPNSIQPLPYEDIDPFTKKAIKSQYNLPTDCKIFIYGGNLGIPQGLDFLLRTITAMKDNPKIYFLIVGSGTEFDRIQKWFKLNTPTNAMLISGLPKQDYDNLMKICDVGMIFLHKDFTIPNFPSRLLSYLEFKLPVLVAADPNTDIGTEVERNRCGFSVPTGNLEKMIIAVNSFCDMSEEEFEQLRNNSRNYLEQNFLVSQSYNQIMNYFNFEKTNSL